MIDKLSSERDCEFRTRSCEYLMGGGIDPSNGTPTRVIDREGRSVFVDEPFYRVHVLRRTPDPETFIASAPRTNSRANTPRGGASASRAASSPREARPLAMVAPRAPPKPQNPPRVIDLSRGSPP